MVDWKKNVKSHELRGMDLLNIKIGFGIGLSAKLWHHKDVSSNGGTPKTPQNDHV